MERRKYLGWAVKKYINEYDVSIIRAELADIAGYASYMKIISVHQPLIVGENLRIYDDGYSELIFQPDDEKWRVCALFNNNGEIVEWYFDITRYNGVDEAGEPYCDDLYLDAALTPDGSIAILDEDELLQALNEGGISKSDYDSAYDTLKMLLKKGIISVSCQERLCQRLMALFR